MAARLGWEALALEPESVIAHLNLAGALVTLRRPTAAREHLEAAQRLDPDFAIAHRGLAHLGQQQGRRDRALQQLLAAEALARRDLQTLADLADLGHLFAKQGDAAGAGR